MRAVFTAVPESQKADRAANPTSAWNVLLPFTLIFAAACAMYYYQLGDIPIFNPDEALYAEPAREMLETGEYITTLLNYVVRFTKPPLVIWGMAASYAVFGVNEFAARFLPAACGAIMVGITYVVIAKYATGRAALLGAFTLITAPLFVGTARHAITDMPLTLMVAGALFAFFHGFTQCAHRWKWIGYTLVGLAVMTKGPVGLVLPATVMFAFHFLRGDLKEAWSYYKPVLGFLLICAIALPWFITEIYITNGAYYREFILRENFQRFTAVVDHKYPWWYHLAVIAAGFAPWTIFIPQSIYSAARALNFQRGKFWLYGAAKQFDAQKSFTLFSLLTVCIIVTFFSISVSKLATYTLPAFPALGALVGIYLDKSLAERNNKAVLFPFLLLTIALGVGLAILPVAMGRLRDAPTELVSLLYSAMIVMLVSGIACCFSAFRKRSAAAVTFFCIAFYFSMLGFGSHALKVVSDAWEEPLTRFARFAGQSKWPIIVFHMRKPSMPFYAGRQVKLPYDEAGLIRMLGETDGAYILAKADRQHFLESMPNCRVVARDGRFILVAQRPRSEAKFAY
jgi:4-amino-4-deoxy-L-arabinose transferase-like glycosyltransferase